MAAGGGLAHFSEEAGITRFVPRRASTTSLAEPVVWAVDEEHLHNYLFPRVCPRVTFYAVPSTSRADVDRFLAVTPARFVVAIEARWLPVVRRTCLYRYDLPPESFAVHDAGAGYYISREPVAPRGVTAIPDLLAALTERGDVELRVMPSLWPLHDAVVASTMQFSMIRMRHAAPRP